MPTPSKTDIDRLRASGLFDAEWYCVSLGQMAYMSACQAAQADSGPGGWACYAFSSVASLPFASPEVASVPEAALQLAVAAARCTNHLEPAQ